ncbi:Vsp/OspC family lipoprotein [Borrelia turicatae]|uniref:Outer surface membrane lipoprotein VspE n=2 Tax=Borrelia turicatae TaxID=142 RepID=Q9RQ59_BORTU|nr:Vsp/OspC family lipoprotein [Borrelia turicatae]AAD56754.1 outer surface membrane lipoprotein VspE [Borrelia turicatae]ASJ27663.1 Vsp7 [Borrelia turicatae 91E135]UPA14189.1 hypothetical protein bt91E135_001372 [Borrelia turicatae 91E135]
MKRITLSALLMTLFLLMSCNNSGTSPKDGQAAKSDGTVIDLATISKNIKDTVAFAKSVKDVHTLVKSIDELAKAIGQKIQQNSDQFANDGAHNGSLISGAFQVILTVETKLKSLEDTVGLSDTLKTKVTSSKIASRAFLDKVKSKHTELGKEGASDADAKAAILVSNGTKDKGVDELVKLNTEIDALLTAAEAAVTAAINALSTPAKSDAPAQSN